MAIDSIFNVWRQNANTTLVQAAVETVIEKQPRPARQLATLVSTTEDKISLERASVKAFGKGKFKAFGASNPIFVPKIRYAQSEIELVQLSEQSPIDERLMRKLESNDEDVVRRAGADFILRARALQIRNENLSDWMVMTALLTGQLPINFADAAGQGLVIDYGYDPTHLVTTGLPWSNPASALPIDDLRAGQAKLADDAGDYGIDIWMTTPTFQKLIYSNQAKSILTGTDRGQLIPTIDDVKARLFEGERINFHVTDAGYRDESAGYNRGRGAHTKWLPDGKVLMLAGSSGVDAASGLNGDDGLPVIEQFDGRVLVRTAYDKRELRQGPQTVFKIDDSDTETVIQTSTRMPRINHPENVLVLTV